MTAAWPIAPDDGARRTLLHELAAIGRRHSDARAMIAACLARLQAELSLDFAAYHDGAPRPGAIPGCGWIVGGAMPATALDDTAIARLSEAAVELPAGVDRADAAGTTLLVGSIDAGGIRAALIVGGSRRWTAADARLAGEAADRLWENVRQVERLQTAVADVRHRICSTLAAIRATTRHTAQTSVTLADFEMHFEGRLGAITRALAASLRGDDGAVDLQAILLDELGTLLAREGEQFTLDGPAVRLPFAIATDVALALHELGTGSLEHGALSHPGGGIAIGWRVDGEGATRRIALSWREHLPDGVRAHVPPGTYERLAETLTHELRGAVSIDAAAGGLHCDISFALARGR